MALVTIGDGAWWSLLNGTWQDEPAGELRPPNGTRGESAAGWNRAVYEDFTARVR